MLKGPLLHPGLLAALAGAGHGSLLLVADANYPASTTAGPHASLIHLNLRPGMIDAVTIVAAIASAVPIEQAYVMAPVPDGPYSLEHDPPIWSDFAAALADAGSDVALEPLERQAFYALAATPQVALIAVSGETRLYGNLMLRIGVLQAPQA